MTVIEVPSTFSPFAQYFFFTGSDLFHHWVVCYDPVPAGSNITAYLLNLSVNVLCHALLYLSIHFKLGNEVIRHVNQLDIKDTEHEVASVLGRADTWLVGNYPTHACVPLPGYSRLAQLP